MRSPEELKPVSVTLEIIGEPAHIEYINVGSFWGGWGVGDTPYKDLCGKAPTNNRINFNFSGFKVYERVGISTTSFPGFSPTHHYGVRELKERPWLGLVMCLQNKINSEGGILCPSIFLFHSRNDHKPVQDKAR